MYTHIYIGHSIIIFFLLSYSVHAFHSVPGTVVYSTARDGSRQNKRLPGIHHDVA